MGNQGKRAAKDSVCMGIQCQIISLKFKFCKICELKTLDTRKTILFIKFEECSCVRKRVISSYVFHTFVNKADGKIYRVCREFQPHGTQEKSNLL